MPPVSHAATDAAEALVGAQPAAIVAGRESLGWVTALRSRGGRALELNLSTATIASLDIGGTSIKRGGVCLPEQLMVGEPIGVDALAEAEELLAQISFAAADLLAEHADCHDLAVAFPRPFDMARGTPLLRGVHKFDSIYGVPLAPVLRSGVDREIRISFCGDAIAAAMGEATAGAGRSTRRMLMVTIGTGFGAAMVADGREVEQHEGRTVEEIHLDAVANRGPADEVLSALGLAGMLGVEIGEVEGMAQRSEQLPVFEEYGSELGGFLAVQARHFEPDVIVVGGGASGAFDLFGPDAAALLDVPLLPAELGNTAGLLGAAILHGQGTLL